MIKPTKNISIDPFVLREPNKNDEKATFFETVIEYFFFLKV